LRPGSMWGLWWTKWHWGRFSKSTSISPVNHSTNFSIIIITRGWYNRPLVAAVPTGPNWTPPSTIPNKKKKEAHTGMDRSRQNRVLRLELVPLRFSNKFYDFTCYMHKANACRSDWLRPYFCMFHFRYF
jgi:hypothetical protein